jgi:hypothetical protein
MGPILKPRAHSEMFLRDSPRTLEIVSATALAVLAGMILYSVALFEWCLVTYRQYYQQPDRAMRIEWLTYEGCEVLLALVMLVLAVNVARAARRDRGVFGPLALRVWGIVFATLPIVASVALRSIDLDLHMVLFFWGAAVACFTLAARRSRPPGAKADEPDPMRRVAGVPPPID